MRMALKSFTSSTKALPLILALHEVAAKVGGELEHGVLCGVLHERDALVILAEHLDREAQALQLLDQHLEGFGHARLQDILALDDRLVRLDTANDVVGLDREELLQD